MASSPLLLRRFASRAFPVCIVDSSRWVQLFKYSDTRHSVAPPRCREAEEPPTVHSDQTHRLRSPSRWHPKRAIGVGRPQDRHQVRCGIPLGSRPREQVDREMEQRRQRRPLNRCASHRGSLRTPARVRRADTNCEGVRTIETVEVDDQAERGGEGFLDDTRRALLFWERMTPPCLLAS